MCRIKWERLKTYILLVLMLTSLIQIGILWDYQNHGLPFNFLLGIFNSTGSVFMDSSETVREEFFVPYRITASNGNEYHWIIGRDNSYHRELWEEAKFYLKNALISGKAQQSLPADGWGELITAKAFIFEFKSNINHQLLKWFMGLPEAQAAEAQGLHKMIILPGEGLDEDEVAVYILDNSGIRKYVFPFREGGISYKEYQNIIARLEKGKEWESKEYAVIKDLGLSEVLAINPDVLCVVRGSKFREYDSIRFDVPDRLSGSDEVADAVLGDERDSYDSYIDSQSIVFKNLDSIFRVYNDGFLEYRYIPGTEGDDKGDISSAFANSATFISRVSELLNTKADIYLSRVEEKPDYYQFTFDYRIGDYPIYLDYAEGKDGEPVTSAAVIQANSKRIIKVRWILKNFEFTGEKASYNVNMENIMNDIIGDIAMDSNKPFVVDMGVSYVVKSDADKSLEPVWYVDRNGDNKAVALHKKGE